MVKEGKINFYDSELTDNRYNVIRIDRSYALTNNKRGGGCLLHRTHNVKSEF